MQQQVEAYEPLFAYLFGFRPADVLALTWAQFCRYRDWADDPTTRNGG